MANNDKEIELKFALDKEVFLQIKEKISKIARFVKKLNQVDDYYSPIHRNFVEPEYPFEWLSIRRRGDKTILNYKHFYPENSEITTHCDEFENEIKDAEQLKKIFSSLDIKKLVTIEKEREVYVNDEFEIAMDIVKELGYFIEIEAIKDFRSVEKAREKLFEFAKMVGIDISKFDKKGYPYLLMEKKGLI